MKIGYFCSEFPALSHTFISREIVLLEREGFEVVTASANPTRGLEKMGSWDQERAARTEVLKTAGASKIIGALAGCLFRGSPFFRGLGFAFSQVWRRGPRSLVKAAGYFVQAVLLDAWTRKQQINHIHVHFGNPGSTVVLIARQMGQVRFSISIHGPDEFYDEERLLLKQKIQSAEFVRCISYYSRSQLMRLVPSSQWNKFTIVRCGLYPGEFTFRPPTGAPVRRILCVGRLCSNKGQAVLMEAARILRSQGAEFQLTLLGGGEDLEAIRAVVADFGLGSVVTVAGPVGHDRVKAELLQADLFVLPSFAEGIPVALMEAMAAGVPVVTTAITGIPELIEDGVSGFLTQASNAEQLAAVLGRLIDGSTPTGPVAVRAAEVVSERYNVETNTRGLAQLFRTLGPAGGVKGSSPVSS